MADDVMAGVYGAVVLYLAGYFQSLLNMAKRQTSETAPEILEVTPQAAIPGGEFLIRGRSLTSDTPSLRAHRRDERADHRRLRSFVVARVPEGASVGEITIGEAGQRKQAVDLRYRHPDRRRPASR